jgi:two-component system sensor histidine kinase TctE
MHFLKQWSRSTEFSLHRRLVLWVLLPQLVLWIAAGFATARLAVHYVNQAADATLLQATRAVADRIQPMGDRLVIDFPDAAQKILEADPGNRYFYTISGPPGKFLFGNFNIPLPPSGKTPGLNSPSFYDAEILQSGTDMPSTASQPTRVRVAALYVAYSGTHEKRNLILVQVARSVATRENIWELILTNTLLPLSGLILLMTLIVWVSTRKGLGPILRLRRAVEDRSPSDLTPLKVEAAPRELSSLVRALNDLLASLRQSMDAQRRFIGDAAHQLRTPLAALKTQADLALEANRDPTVSTRLEIVHQNVMRSAHVIDRLLMLARAEPESPIALDKSIIELTALVRNTVAEKVPRALSFDVDLGMAEIDLGSYWVEANGILLSEALNNILDNAIEYSGPRSEITVSTSSDGQYAMVSVSDTGPGLPLADRARVFERFVRATDIGVGCGLGLAIVKEIVLRHGGTVVLDDVKPHGLKVTVCLPLRHAPSIM